MKFLYPDPELYLVWLEMPLMNVGGDSADFSPDAGPAALNPEELPLVPLWVLSFSESALFLLLAVLI